MIRRWRDDSGAGLIGLAWGVLAFWMFLLLAVQLAMVVHTRTTTTGLGYEATRQAALGGGTPQAIAAADRWLEDRAGDLVTERRWSRAGDSVVLEVVIRPPTVLPASLVRWPATSSRRFTVHSETGLP